MGFIKKSIFPVLILIVAVFVLFGAGIQLARD